MTKFNRKTSVGRETAKHPDLVGNKEGGVAFKPSPKTELTLRILTYLVKEPKYYGNTEKEFKELQELIEKVAETNPEYLMKLAVYARHELYLRSAPIFLLIESAQYDSVKPFIREWTPKIINRADELTEAIAFFIEKHGEIGSRGEASLPNSLKKGIADSFHNFDEYQFAKYNRDKEVKLKDVIRLVHPKPENEEESAIFGRIVNDNLKTPETWEVALSRAGQNDISKKEAWESLIPEMGYMALLRNLRNFVQEEVDLEPVLSTITDPERVKWSRQFPFRFYTAYKVLKNKIDPFDFNKISKALSEALEISTENLPIIGGKTMISVDHSGSMTDPISRRSIIRRKDIADVMGALSLRMFDNAIVSAFGESFAIDTPNPNNSVLDNVEKIGKIGVGHSTNGWLAIKYLREKNIEVDRVIIISDMQLYSTRGGNRFGLYNIKSNQSLYDQFKLYKSEINPDVKLYSFDLAGYGTVQIPEEQPNVALIPGWSDRVLKFIPRFESFGETMIEDIESYNS